MRKESDGGGGDGGVSGWVGGLRQHLETRARLTLCVDCEGKHKASFDEVFQKRSNTTPHRPAHLWYGWVVALDTKQLELSVTEEAVTHPDHTLHHIL